MIDNAFATAIAAAKKLIALNNEDDNQLINNEQKAAILMIKNSGTIISAAIDSYGELVGKINHNISGIFDSVWNMIPVPNSIPNSVEDLAKTFLKQAILDKFKVEPEYMDTSSIKHSYEEKFIDIITELANIPRISHIEFGVILNALDIK